MAQQHAPNVLQIRLRMLAFMLPLVSMTVLASQGALGVEPDFALVADGSLAQDIANAVSPPNINVEGTSTPVIDVFYCGSDHSNGAVLFLLGTSTAHHQELLKSDDCKRSLLAILHEYEPIPNVVGVAHVMLSSHPYSVTVRIDDAVVRAGSLPTSKELVLKQFTKTFPMNSLPLNADFYHEHFAGLVHFDDDKIILGLFQPSTPPSQATLPNVNIPPSPSGRFRNLVVLIQHSYITHILATYSRNLVFTASNPNGSLSGFDYSGSDGQVNILGNIHARVNVLGQLVTDDATAKLTFTGSDLTVSNVDVTPRIETCSGSKLQQAACNLRNRGHAAFATSIKELLRHTLLGKFIRPANIAKPFRVNAFNSTLTFRLAVNQASATDHWLIFSGGALLKKEE